MSARQRLLMEIGLLLGLPVLAGMFALWPDLGHGWLRLDSLFVRVVVAQKNLAMGDPIPAPEKLFAERMFLRGTEPTDAITELGALRGCVLKRDLQAGAVITPNDLFFFHKEKPLPWPLVQGLGIFARPGYRFVGIRVSLARAEEIFARLDGQLNQYPHVDIVAFSCSDDGPCKYVLAADSLVVTTDIHLHRNEDGEPMPPAVVTVVVRAEDALKIRLANSIAAIDVLLRQQQD